MNKAQIDYICQILKDTYMNGAYDGFWMDSEINNYDFRKLAEGYAEALDRLSIAEDEGYMDRDAEIIRCKDCTHFEYGTDIGYCWCNDIRMDNDDYCSWAKRKDEEE